MQAELDICPIEFSQWDIFCTKSWDGEYRVIESLMFSQEQFIVNFIEVLLQFVIIDSLLSNISLGQQLSKTQDWEGIIDLRKI